MVIEEQVEHAAAAGDDSKEEPADAECDDTFSMLGNFADEGEEDNSAEGDDVLDQLDSF